MVSLTNVGRLTEFWRVVRELNPEAVRRDVEGSFGLAFLGRDDLAKRSLRRMLRPSESYPPHTFLLEPSGVEVAQGAAPPRADLYFYVVDAGTGLNGQDVAALEQLYLLARPTVLVFAARGCCTVAGPMDQLGRDLGGLVGSVLVVDVEDGPGTEQHLAALLLRTLPGKSLVAARRLPPLRAGAADALIASTARVNAEFALLSGLPAGLPIVGSVMGAGADLLVLTKNQAMMVLRLAAVYGRDLERRWQLAAEIAPVVGGAFAWRTLARLLVGLLPAPLGLVPKTAVAFAGTVVVGKIAKYYYEHGVGPSGDLTRRFAGEAVEEWRGALAGVAG